MRRQVLKLLARTEDDLTDAELMGRGSEEFHEMALWLDLGRVPSEMDAIGCREYTRLRAYGLVRRAMDDLQRFWRDVNSGRGA